MSPSSRSSWRAVVGALVLGAVTGCGTSDSGSAPDPPDAARAVEPPVPGAPATGSGAAASATERTPDAALLPDAGAPGTDSGPAPAAGGLPLPFLEWVAGHCHVDELGPSAYTFEWLRYEARRSELDPDALWPLPSGARPPWPGSPDATRLAAKLRRQWLDKPASHVVDCTYWQPLRTCPRCRPGQLAARYVAYLPAALFTEPERVRALALLVPGGRGGRSRAFLSPIPNKTIWNMGSGGLRTKQLVDAYLAAHPESVPPIVVSLESRGTELNNGQTEHLSRDLPQHIAETYLGGVPLADLVLGAEGISSGGRAVMETLFDEPAAFHAVALTCMACGKLDPGRPFGFAPEVFDRWADALQARAAAGHFELRFTIGSRDGQKPCSSALYSIFGAHGLFDLVRPPVYTNCQAGKPESEDGCDTERPGWVSYAGEMHHYGLLKKSWAPELEWLLGALERVRQRRAAAP